MNLDEELKIYMQTVQCLDESTDDYLYVYDLANDQLYFADKIREKYDLPLGKEGISLPEWAKIVYPKDLEQLEQNIRDIKNQVIDNHDMEYRIVDKKGNKVWISCRGTVVKDKESQPAFLMGSISELAMARKVDNLTGLWNYEKFMENMGKSLRETQGYLMLFGIDNFKNINVKNGRTFGNQLLKTIVNILEENSDRFIKLYRLDGDRFAVDFPWKIRADVTAFYRILKKELEKYCTISAGVVDYYSDDGEDSSIIYQYAENALDRAKKEGKDKIIFFSFEDYQKSLEQIQFQDELKTAVKEDFLGFYLCYQPQIKGEDFSTYGAEALLRYESPWRGIVSPMEFIPFLEQNGLICKVGEWGLRTAVEQCVRWRKYIPDFHISVNISYVQLRQENITELVLDILSEAGLPGNALTLEVTESMQLQDYSYFNKIFYEWKRHGIKISIDDFGTGYSSLSYLKSIDVDETKIDRCFINRIYNNIYNYRLLSNIIELAHGARIQVCCEGVETEEELAALQKLKPDVLQGFLFAKPYTAEEFEEYYIYEDSEKYQERLRKEKAFLHGIKELENKPLIEEYRRDEMLNIVEGMDDIVYVSDLATYELYYMNSAARKLTGIYDYKGRKCYQVLHGKDHPCESCNNKYLKNESFYTWEIENEFLDTHFVVKDKLISWRGNVARLEIAVDVGKKDVSYQWENEPVYVQRGERKNILSWSFSHKLLNQVALGIWVIRIDEMNGKFEMYTDDIMNRILGLKDVVSPEECYRYWYDRIVEEDKEYINLTVENIIQSGKIYQVEYMWVHPERGTVPVRCVGIRAEDREGAVCIQGYHRIISDMERLENSGGVRRKTRKQD